MAKQTLPTNYKDDVLTTSMGKKRRYNLIQNDDGTISLEDATEYTQVGDNYGAAQLNATNQAVNESVDQAKVIDSLDDISANTQPGMVAGALAVAELKGKRTPQVATYSDTYTFGSSDRTVTIPKEKFPDIQSDNTIVFIGIYSNQSPRCKAIWNNGVQLTLLGGSQAGNYAVTVSVFFV